MIVNPAQIPDDFPGNNQPDYRGNERGGTGNISAHGAFPCAGRADTVRPAADGRIFQRPDRLLRGINNFQFFDSPFAAFAPDDPG